MSYQSDRDDFIINGSALGLTRDQLYALLRYSTTLQRLAEAQCNGDWPADNGERKVVPCPRCESCFVPSSFKRSAFDGAKVCPDCRTQDRVSLVLNDTPLRPWFQGDPRGPVLQLFPVGTSHDDMDCGKAKGLYVPAGRTR